MTPFLRSVADAYASVPPQLLKEYCFVFPNKRSSAFFLKYFSESLPAGAVALAPKVTTISDFVEDLSGLTVDSHIDLLFSLYSCYLDLIRGGKIANIDADDSPGESLPDFDSFVRWGETVLQDFNDVDLFCVDNRVVFKNVEDFRKISSNYLTDSQRYVMREYFNYEPSVSEVESFWQHFPKDGKRGSQRFKMLWEILSPLYELFSRRLAGRKLSTQGGAYRVALERLREAGKEILPCRRIVIVGFNVLTMAEFNIFSLLKKFRCDPEFAVGGSDAFADFYWDATGPVLDSDSRNSANRFVKFNMTEFPSPEWASAYIARSEKTDLPELLEVVASPSNSMQAKIASEIVARQLRDSGEVRDFSDANVAVVLPDEGLLFPLLYALPSDINLNLTMGYPLRQTAPLTFVALLRKVLLKRRMSAERGVVVFKPDLIALLGHPFIQRLGDPEDAVRLGDFLSDFRASEVSASDIDSVAGGTPLGNMLREILNLPRPKGDPTPQTTLAILRHLAAILASMKRRLLAAVLPPRPEDLPEDAEAEMSAGDSMDTELISTLDIAHIDIYSDALRRLSDAVELHSVPMAEQTALFLAERLLGGEKVEFEGEPLSGLQVMGLLETRGLDFEYLIIPSLNERIFPRRARSRSFIPDALRHAYGMPPSNYQESLFSYYFYRMISRAKKVWLIYDARVSGGTRNGEPSRYITQLQYLHAPEHIRRRECGFVIPDSSVELEPIVKTPEVMRNVIDAFRRHSPEIAGRDSAPTKNFSPSALARYITCPAKFYYEYVMGFKEESRAKDYVDAAAQGSIFHGAIEILYPEATPMTPVMVTPEMIGEILADRNRIYAATLRSAAVNYYRLTEEADIEAKIKDMPGDVLMVADQIVAQVEDILRHDLSLAPFRLLGSELKDTFAFPVRVPESSREEYFGGEDTFNVNMTFAIDRLDLISDRPNAKSDPRPVLRIVDYKTGKTHLSSTSEENLFLEAANARQLFIYSRMLACYRDARGFHPDIPVPEDSIPDPLVEIYSVLDMKHRSLPELGQGRDKKFVTRYSQIADTFNAQLDAKMSEIFDKEIPFAHNPSPSVCGLCHLRSLCRR